jgi:hypothetical protein
MSASSLFLASFGNSYFSFTKSKTKIAHTPTVTGNCTNAASRNGPPLGSAYVSNIIATAVSTPRTSLLFQFMRDLRADPIVSRAKYTPQESAGTSESSIAETPGKWLVLFGPPYTLGYAVLDKEFAAAFRTSAACCEDSSHQS